MKDHFAFPWTGGLSRLALPSKADPSTFYNLENFRPSRTRVGTVEQTPWFYNWLTAAQGTYWNGAAGTTEPLASAVMAVDEAKFVYMSQYVIRPNVLSNQYKVFYQTTYPAAETIYTGCLLVINNVTALAIALGSKLDVEMTATAAFRWRKNGGGWTAGVPSTAGVAIDGGNATVYFLASTGYAGTEAWSWTRTDCSFEYIGGNPPGQFDACPFEIKQYKNKVYFTNLNYRLMTLQDDDSAVNYVISTGYRPVYGLNFDFFDDHLIVFYYGKTFTAPSSWSGTTRAITLGWSDKADLNNFIATDVNEADQLVLPISQRSSIIGGLVTSTQLFVFTTTDVFFTSALGLPVVFDFQRLTGLTSYAHPGANSGQRGVALTDNGVYVLSADNVLFFDGSSFSGIGLPVVSAPNGGSLCPFGRIYYDKFYRELHCFTAGMLKMYTYSEVHKTWWSRNTDFLSGVQCVYTSQGIELGSQIASTLMLEDTGGLQTPLKDLAAGVSFTTPKICTQVFDAASLQVIKEFSLAYLAATVTAVAGAGYTTGAALVAQLYYYSSDTGQITGSPQTNSNAVWNSGSTNGLVDIVRPTFRGIALEIQANAANSKPPAYLQVHGLEFDYILPNKLTSR